MTGAEFDDLVTAHGAELLRVAYLLSRDSALAEDLVQEALVKALRHWRNGGRPDHPLPYLRKIVLNEYLGWRRRWASTEIIGLPITDPASAEPVGNADDRAVMWQVLGTLPPRARAVLVLRYYQGLPDREIADELGCAVSTVRSIAARAFAQLRQHSGLADLAPRTGLGQEA